MRTFLVAACKSLLVVTVVLAVAVLADETTGPVSRTIKQLNSQACPGNKPSGNESRQFGKTIRLEFNLVSAESSQPFVVLCSEGDFAVHYELQTAGSGNSVDIGGRVAGVDESGKLLLTFKVAVHINHPSDDVRGLLSAMGSSVVSLDKPQKLVSIDTYSIQITAAVAE